MDENKDSARARGSVRVKEKKRGGDHKENEVKGDLCKETCDGTVQDLYLHYVKSR